MDHKTIDIRDTAAVPTTTVDTRNTAAKQCQAVLLSAFIIAAVIYTCGVGVYEIEVGGSSAALIAKYYDYSTPLNGTSVRVAIDALPRDIYANTKTVAGLMITFGVLGVASLVGIIVYACIKQQKDIMYYTAVSNVCVVLLPFCYASFITWKLHSLSQDDKDTWNAVDAGFINNFYEVQKILILTCIPGGIWLMIGCAIWIMSSCRCDDECIGE